MSSVTYTEKHNPLDFLVVGFSTDLCFDRDHYSTLSIVSKQEYQQWKDLYDLGTDFILQFPSLEEDDTWRFRSLWTKMQVFDKPADVLVIHRMFGAQNNTFGSTSSSIFQDVIGPSYQTHLQTNNDFEIVTE